MSSRQPTPATHKGCVLVCIRAGCCVQGAHGETIMLVVARTRWINWRRFHSNEHIIRAELWFIFTESGGV